VEGERDVDGGRQASYDECAAEVSQVEAVRGAVEQHHVGVLDPELAHERSG
jgi:DNA-binding FrmR family transcriptional regulator